MSQPQQINPQTFDKLQQLFLFTQQGKHEKVQHQLAQLLNSSEELAAIPNFQPICFKRSAVGMMAACARTLPQSSEVNALFSKMTAFSAAQQPGFVPGLSRTHDPKTGDWAQDAAQWFKLLSQDPEPVVQKATSIPMDEDEEEVPLTPAIRKVFREICAQRKLRVEDLHSGLLVFVQTTTTKNKEPVRTLVEILVNRNLGVAVQLRREDNQGLKAASAREWAVKQIQEILDQAVRKSEV